MGSMSCMEQGGKTLFAELQWTTLMLWRQERDGCHPEHGLGIGQVIVYCSV